MSVTKTFIIEFNNNLKSTEYQVFYDVYIHELKNLTILSHIE